MTRLYTCFSEKQYSLYSTDALNLATRVCVCVCGSGAGIRLSPIFSYSVFLTYLK